MHFNRSFHLSSEPFISHMRIAWQDGIRKNTEEYWRAKIAAEILTKFPYASNIDIIAKEIRSVKNNN